MDAHNLGSASASDVEAVSCTGSSDALRRACEFDVLDEFFIGVATCAHSASEDGADTCLQEYVDGRDEALDECGAVTEARLSLFSAAADAVHNPPFGLDFAANFIDPLTIGQPGGAEPHPCLPLVQGSTWVLEGTFIEDGEEITETITITVTDRIKFIDGSFKAGRDGDEAGILLPAVPVVGDIFRQEVSFTNAEDAIEIVALDGTESVPAASCTGDCLITLDFSPLDPGVEEHKYYAPGIGMILEVNLDTGDRVELISYDLGVP